jgi:hypothetical protein
MSVHRDDLGRTLCEHGRPMACTECAVEYERELEKPKETTLQHLNGCRAVLRMHGVMSEAESRRILRRIVGTYGESPNAITETR